MDILKFSKLLASGKFLTIADFARLKKCKRVTIARNIAKGKIETKKIFRYRLIPLTPKNEAWQSGQDTGKPPKTR